MPPSKASPLCSTSALSSLPTARTLTVRLTIILPWRRYEGLLLLLLLQQSQLLGCEADVAWGLAIQLRVPILGLISSSLTLSRHSLCYLRTPTCNYLATSDARRFLFAGGCLGSWAHCNKHGNDVHSPWGFATIPYPGEEGKEATACCSAFIE